MKENIYRILGEQETGLNSYSNISLVVKRLDRQKGQRMASRHHSVFKAIFIIGIIIHTLGYIFFMFFLKNPDGLTFFRVMQNCDSLDCFFMVLTVLFGLVTPTFVILFWYPLVKYMANRTRRFLLTNDSDYFLLIKNCKDDNHFGRYSDYPVLDEEVKARMLTFQINSMEI